MIRKIILGCLMYTGMQAQVPSGAIGDWPFDNNAQDMSGNGNHGTVSGAIPAPDRFNQPNKAYRFSGFSNYVFVPNNTSIDIAAGIDFSFAMWMKSYSSTQTAAILAKHVSGTWNGYTMIINNNFDPGYCMTPKHMLWYTASGAMEDACSDNPLIVDTLWHFIVGMHDALNNKSYLYIDNVLQSDVGQRSGTISNTSNLYFGGYINSNSFDGVLDGARLYKRLLTSQEVTALYNEGGCGAPATPVSFTPSGNLMICNSQSTTLYVSATGVVNWYSSPTSTIVLGTGSSYSTPALNAGVYTYYASATTCTTSARAAITVTVSGCTSLNVLDENVSLSIYPNPNKGSFTLKTNASATTEAVLVNQLGQEVLRKKIESAEMAIDLNLPSGVYFLKIVSPEKVLALQKLAMIE